MPETRIGAAIASDLTNAMTDFSVTPVIIDGVNFLGSFFPILEGCSNLMIIPLEFAICVIVDGSRGLRLVKYPSSSLTTSI